MQIIASSLWLSFITLANANYVSWRDIDVGRYGSYPVQKFTSSKVKAPYVNFIQRTPACNDGLQYFITPRGWKNKDPGPMILDENGTLIWAQHFDNEFGGQAYDLRVQKYKGIDYLTFWLGDDRIRGHGAGHYYMLNSSYDIVHKVGAANNKFADLHEFTITAKGTALLIVFEPIEADVRPVGRKFSDLWNQAAWDCLFQEIDIATGNLIFEWRASAHLNMNLSYNSIETPDIGTREKPFDWIHLNSVDKDELGNYLVSARNMHALIYVNGKTHDVIWTLGGKGNDFHDLSGGRVLNMAWQHDAKFVAPEAFPETYTKPKKTRGNARKLIALFDNAALDWDYHYGTSYSRALLLEITYPTSVRKTKSRHDRGTPVGDLVPSLNKIDVEKVKAINVDDPAYTVRIIQEYINPQHVRSSTQGSVQVVAHGKAKDSHLFVGYGINSVLTEFHGNGTVACDIHFGAKSSWETGDIQSYRAYKALWMGKPKEPPAIVKGRGKAFVSWNGATEVRQWLLQAAFEAQKGWEDIVLVPKTSFETEIRLKTSDYDVSRRLIRVQAIDGAGQICANGVSEAAATYRLAAGIISRFKAGSMSHLGLAIIVLGSGMALILLLKRFRRRSIPRDRRLD